MTKLLDYLFACVSAFIVPQQQLQPIKVKVYQNDRRHWARPNAK